MMQGREGGRGICVVAEVLLVVLAVWLGLETKSFIVALFLGLFPLFAFLGAAGSSATRLVRDSRAKTMSAGK